MKQLGGTLYLVGTLMLLLVGYSTVQHWLLVVGGLMILVGPIVVWVSKSMSSGISSAVMSNPNSAMGQYLRGNTLRAQNAPDLAIEAYTRAIELNPRLAEAYNNRGLTYRSQGEHELAITDWTKAIELAPKFAAAYLNRGIAHAARSEPELAIADCTKAIELDSRLSGAYYFRGEAYRANCNPKLAIPDFLKYLELNPRAVERSQLAQWMSDQSVEIQGTSRAQVARVHRAGIAAQAEKGKINDTPGDDFDSWKAKQQGNKSAG